ncbi:MAG TPA: glycosyltransferase family 39 protein [Acidobacteriaceae bacterium]|nr:glycosyltransferase family 39 protein [Acidobacteriaceae bacterium]
MAEPAISPVAHTTGPLVDKPPSVPSAALPRIEWLAIIVLCAAKLLLHIFTSVQRYGYFRDELYYLDLGRHLAFGYVDCAPLVALYARVALLLGGSLAALRILPALAGTALIALSILIARELSGPFKPAFGLSGEPSRYAQWLTGITVLLCPGFLVMDSFLSMNAFEPLFWMAGAWALARFLRTGNSRLWIVFGVCIGLGLENKHSAAFFAVAVVIAVLLTRHRREFLKPWIWIGIAVAFALFAPNLIWQIRHHFPTLEDLENVRRTHKDIVLGPGAFIARQILDLHPILFPVWLTGVLWTLWSRRWRVLGLTFVVFFVMMELMHGKEYYLFPAYPMMLAAGSVCIAGWLNRFKRPALATTLRAAILTVIILAMAAFVPMSTWMLSPENYLAYARAIGFMPKNIETHQQSILPQPMADQFGWPELVAQTAAIYNSLPPAQRAHTALLTGNYGEAGAIDLFGPRYGLPHAISGHQNYWYWGPGATDYTNLIVFEWDLSDVKKACQSWQAFPHYSKYGMAEENSPIYLCRGARFNLQKEWAHFKHWN